MELHFGDEQFEVDAAELPVAFAQVTLWGGGEERRGATERREETDEERHDQSKENSFPPPLQGRK